MDSIGYSDDLSDFIYSAQNRIMQMFPSELFYNIAKKYDLECIKGQRAAYRRVVGQFLGNGAVAILKPEPEGFEAIEDIMQNICVIEAFLPGIREAIEAEESDMKIGIYHSDGSSGAPSKRTAMRLIECGKKYAAGVELLKGNINHTLELLVSNYILMAKNIVVCAESKDYDVISECLERRDFRDRVVRLAYGNYEMAAHAYEEIFNAKLRDLTVEKMAAELEKNALHQSLQISELGNFRRRQDFILELKRLSLERLKEAFSSKEDDIGIRL